MASASSAEFNIDVPPEKGSHKTHEEIPHRKDNLFVSFLKKLWKMGTDDPRKVAHALKVGLALSVVSVIYLAEPLFDGVGDSSIWAVMTVVVVFEFTAGATLSKGLNRGFGTLLAGGLALLVGYLSAVMIGDGTTGEAIYIGVIVFVLGAAATFIRFMPNIKSKYDYGLLVFILTFNMITVSGYRQEKIYVMAYKRLITIAIGSAICLVISLMIYPIWAGEDLHFMIINNFECLIKSLEECVDEYFEGSTRCSWNKDGIAEDPIYKKYKSVLDSKASEESLATFASWEPRHGRFHMRYPWNQYVKIGAMLRQCAYSVVALHGCLRSVIQTPPSVRSVLKTQCRNVSDESVKLLRKLANSIRRMEKCRSSCGSSIMENSLHLAVEDLRAVLNAQREVFVDSQRWSSCLREIPEIEEQDAGSDKSSETLSRTMEDTKIPMSKSVEEDKLKKDKSISAQWHVSLDDVLTTKDYCLSGKLQRVEFAGALGVVTFANLLMELAARIEYVVTSVEELGKLGNFKAQEIDADDSDDHLNICCCLGSRRKESDITQTVYMPNQNSE